ncbi:hypothetical protein A2U01_0112277, partial [Trifolium medium]|nr:hypothetical protein [Trifolium medium]
MVAATCYCNDVFDPLMAEAKAMLKTVQLAM